MFPLCVKTNVEPFGPDVTLIILKYLQSPGEKLQHQPDDQDRLTSHRPDKIHQREQVRVQLEWWCECSKYRVSVFTLSRLHAWFT